MLFERFDPFFKQLVRLLGIINAHLVRAGNGNTLEVFRAEYAADSGASGGALVAENRCVFHEVFACRADNDLAAFDLAAALLIELLLYALLRRRCAEAFKLLGIVEFYDVVMYLDPCELFAFSGNDERIVAGFFEIVPEVSAAV